MNTALLHVGRCWLSIIIFIIPFQYVIGKYIVSWSDSLITVVRYIDELTIIVFFPLALIELYKNRKNAGWEYFALLSPILFFIIFGIISGIINGNPLLVTGLGTFDYIKNFLVIFVYAAFFKDISEFKKVFRIALAIAVFMGVVALVQELWAVIFRYILQKDFHDSSMYILRDTPIKLSWRLGIYRTASLMYNPNLFGLYSVLFLLIYLNMVKKINFAVFIPLITGVIVSVSRMVYTGFVIVSVFQIIKGRKWFSFIIIPPLIVLLSMSMFWDFNLLEMMDLSNSSKLNAVLSPFENETPMLDNATSYREYSYKKGMEVWKDHPYFGVGPGMFGGIISVKYNSFRYEEYNFSAMSLLEHITSFDQVWPQVLAEMGITGTFAFVSIFISLIVTFLSLRRRAESNEARGLLESLMIFLIVILIYTLGSGLNLTAVLFTYCAIAGMGIGQQSKLRQ